MKKIQKKAVWGGCLVLFLALPAFAEQSQRAIDRSPDPRPCDGCTLGLEEPADQPVQSKSVVPNMSAPYQMEAPPDPQPRAVAPRNRPHVITPNTPVRHHRVNPAIYEAQAAVQAATQQRQAYEDLYGLGGPLFAATAPSRMGAPSVLNYMGFQDPNLPFYFPQYGRYGGNYGYGAYGPRYGAYGYGAYGGGSPDAVYRMAFRNPQHLENYGLLKIDGPDRYLQKVRVRIDGNDVSVGSKANNWWNTPIVVAAGDHEVDFIREDQGYEVIVKRTITITAAAAQLSLTGKIEPAWLRLSQNEIEHAERQAQLTQP